MTQPENVPASISASSMASLRRPADLAKGAPRRGAPNGASRARGPLRPVATIVSLVALTLVLGACTQIFGTSLAGRWSGTYTDSSGGGGILLLELQVDGNLVAGTWQSSFTGVVLTGTVDGTVDEMILLQLIPDALPECPYTVVAEKDAGKLFGTYASCVPTVGGTFSLNKQ